MKKKSLALLVALVLAIGCVIGGTLAWLTAKTDPVVNTFTYGDINIELTETKPDNRQAKIIPGVDIEKDPKVTVKANSENCWLFVKIDEENWPDFEESDGTTLKVRYEVAEGWTALDGQKGVYYREVSASVAEQNFYVLKGDNTYPNGIVTVSENLTKEDIKGITIQPKLTFTAYAVQKDGIDNAAAAWEKAQPTPAP